MSSDRIIRLVGRIPSGAWTTYQDVGEVVYGHRRGMQSVGNVMASGQHIEGAHRVLRKGGRISDSWRGRGGGPEECLRRLRDELVWDERRGRARTEARLGADALARLDQVTA